MHGDGDHGFIPRLIGFAREKSTADDWILLASGSIVLGVDPSLFCCLIS